MSLSSLYKNSPLALLRMFPCCNPSSDLRCDQIETAACLDREARTSFCRQRHRSVLPKKRVKDDDLFNPISGRDDAF